MKKIILGLVFLGVIGFINANDNADVDMMLKKEKMSFEANKARQLALIGGLDCSYVEAERIDYLFRIKEDIIWFERLKKEEDLEKIKRALEESLLRDKELVRKYEKARI